jgi:inorganic pyrophosphatase
LLQAIPIGGLRMIDDNEADDKIIAVLKDDISYGKFNDITDVPPRLIERLKHYFLTYKLKPTDIESTNRQVEITHVYSKEEAYRVIEASLFDYQQLLEM